MSVGLQLCLAILPIQPNFNCWAKLKSNRDFSAKLKHVLWLGDLKASLSNSSEKLIYNTPSTVSALAVISPDVWPLFIYVCHSTSLGIWLHILHSNLDFVDITAAAALYNISFPHCKQ